jgi:transposase
LTRLRKSLIDDRTRVINRLQKLLESANIKLASVVTDVMGASARAILSALMEGVIEPEALADLAQGRLRQKLPELRRSLEGRFEEHHRIQLEQMLAHIDFLNESIARVSKEVLNRIAPFQPQVELLCTIPGISQRTAEVIISEIGTDMTRFPTAANLASWAGMCPGNHESAGKRYSGRTRKGNSWLRRALLESAWAASRSKNCYLFSQYSRLVARRGKKKAAVAVGHSLLVIVYHVLKNQTPYRDLGVDFLDKLNLQRLQRYHVRRLENLGLKVTIEPLQEAA